MANPPKRFFRTASVADGNSVVLDGRPLRTPKRAAMAVPSEALAAAIADEWNALGERIEPQALPLTRLANTAIDGVSVARTAVIDDLARYAASDLLCYRAEGPAGLVARQTAAWDPWLRWADETFGARLSVTRGLMPVTQPPEAIRALSLAAGPFDAFGLAALHVAAGLTGSLVIALAVAHERLTGAEAWAAATVDDAWQQSQWGADCEAAERAKALEASLVHAARFLSLLGTSQKSA